VIVDEPRNVMQHLVDVIEALAQLIVTHGSH